MKLWIDAEVAVRANRRFRELSGRGEVVSEGEILADLVARDTRDAPNMQIAADAIRIDTTRLGVEEAVAAAPCSGEETPPHLSVSPPKEMRLSLDSPPAQRPIPGFWLILIANVVVYAALVMADGDTDIGARTIASWGGLLPQPFMEREPCAISWRGSCISASCTSSRT